MIRLLIVEARRAMARGVTRLLLIIAVLGLAVTTVWLFAVTKSADTIRADMAAAEAKALGVDDESATVGRNANIRTCVRAMSERTQQAPTTPTTAGPFGNAPTASGPTTTRSPDDWTDVYGGQGTPERIREYCEGQFPAYDSSPPGTGSYRPTYYYGPKIFEYTSLWNDTKGDGNLLLPASLLFFGGLIAGASLIGSEWQTGSFVMFLTWEPRRVRIFLAKASVHAALAFVIGLALLVLFAFALYPTAAIKGSTEGMTGAWFQSVFTAMLRMSAITAFAAALGSALAMIGRRTALALIGVFAYLFIIESIVGAFVDSVRPWLLSLNIAIFMTGTDLDGADFKRTTVMAGFTLFGYTLVFVALAAAAFRRRDFASG